MQIKTIIKLFINYSITNKYIILLYLRRYPVFCKLRNLKI